MSQLGLSGMPPADPEHLTDRQKLALAIIGMRQPLPTIELGAELHAERRRRGHTGHPASEICGYCVTEGRHMGDTLAGKGLVAYKRGEGWTLPNYTTPDTRPGPGELPENF